MRYTTTSKKRISPDIFTDSMQLILNKGKAAANQSSEYQKKQEIKKSTANIIAILKTINIELQNEQDQEISSMLSQQKEIFNKILVQKQTGQKNNFKNAENEIISQLQNQVKNLENSVENKLSLILKSIETQSQNQVQNQIQNQSQNQTKTYAQAATTNVEENNLQQTKKQQKQQEKEKEKEKYREKRLVIQVDKEIAKNIDSYTLRNQINDRFFVKENINSSVIATITKSFTSQLIILTTMNDFSADFLLQKKTV